MESSFNLCACDRIAPVKRRDLITDRHRLQRFSMQCVFEAKHPDRGCVADQPQQHPHGRPQKTIPNAPKRTPFLRLTLRAQWRSLPHPDALERVLNK
jgi:hypothetical protein